MLLSALVLSSLTVSAVATLQIVSGATWTAAGTNQHVQAHGAGITEVDGTYYWIGENKLNGSAFQSINCYSSTDLVQWTFVNELLTQQPSGDLGPNRIVERPKVIYNDDTKQYVMWMHIDDMSYSSAEAGVATCDSVCGNYTYHGASQPLGHQSRDMGLFKDTDGTAYLLSEDRANGLRIDQLSSDYLTAENATYLFADYEAPAMYKSGDTYYLFASHLTGWATNDNQYTTATSLTGPWSDWADFAPAGSDTFNSQTTFILEVNGVVMYMGDRWLSSNLMASTYVWLPLEVSGTNVTMQNHVNWILDVDAGKWYDGPSETTPEAERGALANGAKLLSCSACSNGTTVGWLGGPSDGTLTMSGIASDASTTTTIRVHFENGDSTQRYGEVVVNGESQVLAFLPTGGGSTVADAVLNAKLNAGSSNVIEFKASGSGYCADIDRLMVPRD